MATYDDLLHTHFTSGSSEQRSPLAEYGREVAARATTPKEALPIETIPAQVGQVGDWFTGALKDIFNTREAAEALHEGDYGKALGESGYGLFDALLSVSPFVAAKAIGPVSKTTYTTVDDIVTRNALQAAKKGALPAAAVGTGALAMTPTEAQAGPTKWFSGLLKAIEGAPQPKATGRQWLKYLERFPDTKEEQAYSKLGENLSAFENTPINADDIKGYLANNPGYTLEETRLGLPKEYFELKAEAAPLRRERAGIIKDLRYAVDLRDIELTENLQKRLAENSAKLSLLESALNRITIVTRAPEYQGPMLGEMKLGLPTTYREQIIISPQAEGYSPRHFQGAPEAKKQVAHYGADLRKTPNDETVFMVHEMQSDPHQAGSKVGYGKSRPLPSEEKIFTPTVGKHRLRYVPVGDKSGRLLRERQLENGKWYLDHAVEGSPSVLDDWARFENVNPGKFFLESSRVPDRPLKGQRKGVANWVRRTVRSSLYDAAQEGADWYGVSSADAIAKKYRDETVSRKYAHDIPKAIEEEMKRLGFSDVKVGEVPLPDSYRPSLDNFEITPDQLDALDEALTDIYRQEGRGLPGSVADALDSRDATELWDLIQDHSLEDIVKDSLISKAPQGIRLTPEMRKIIIEKGVPLSVTGAAATSVLGED